MPLNLASPRYCYPIACSPKVPSTEYIDHENVVDDGVNNGVNYRARLDPHK